MQSFFLFKLYLSADHIAIASGKINGKFMKNRKDLCLERKNSAAYNGRGGEDMIIRRIFQRMARMCRPAWYIFKGSLLLSLSLLALALLLTLGSHEQLQTAGAIYETVEAILLIGILASVLVEAQQSRR